MEKDELKKLKNGVECATAVLEYVKVTMPMYELEPTFENMEMVLADAIVNNCLENKVTPEKEFCVMMLGASVLAPIIKKHYENKEGKSE